MKFGNRGFAPHLWERINKRKTATHSIASRASSTLKLSQQQNARISCSPRGAGFSLIEVLVILGITALLSSLAIAYSRIGQRQVSLYIEEQKLASLIFRAKSLALSTFVPPFSSCGYGLRINYALKTYSIFFYAPPGNPGCNTIINTQILPGNVTYFSDQTNLNTDLAFTSPLPADALAYILFVPPNPTTVISVDKSSNCTSGVGCAISSAPGKIYLTTADGSASVVLTVSNAGQIDF